MRLRLVHIAIRGGDGGDGFASESLSSPQPRQQHCDDELKRTPSKGAHTASRFHTDNSPPSTGCLCRQWPRLCHVTTADMNFTVGDV